MTTDLAHKEAFNSDLSLEATMQRLADHGYPSLNKSERGWWCKVKVTVTPKGVDFTVDSDFGMDSMREAAHQCLSRLLKAIKELSI